MVQHLRLAALAAAFFVITYAGVAWVIAGAPRPGLKLGPSTPAATPVNFAARPAEAMPNRAETYSPNDALRLAALQASNAYAVAPCDRAAKAHMIEAVSAYARAWRDVMGCSPEGCDSNRLNAAGTAFSTPLDTRVREAVGAAFDKRGISIDDFPPALRINVAMLVRGRGDAASACTETRAQVGVSR
jgi:hypothetical protein